MMFLFQIPDVPGEEIEGEGVEIASECIEELQGDPKELYSRLKETLSKQIQVRSWEKIIRTTEQKSCRTSSVLNISLYSVI